jgi:V/A-type H+-transporting ATPase subunit E
LLTTVRHVARGVEQQIRQDAEREIEQIRQQAETRADEVRQGVLEEARKQARRILRQRRQQSSREQRAEFLQARDEILQQVWREAEEQLRSLTDREEDYREVLRQLALAAVDTLGPGQWVAASDEKGMKLLEDEALTQWAKAAGQRVGGDVSLQRAAEPADTRGGLIVMARDGRCRADARFSVRLELAREELRGEVLRQLVEA